MKTLQKIVSVLVLVAIILIITGALLAYFYEDKISILIIDKLNHHLKTEIKVEKTHFSFLKKFPNATLEFKNIYATPVIEFNKSDFQAYSDTLFYARKLDLQFNIIELMQKHYTIQSIHVYEGIINMLVDMRGNANYKFWDNQAAADSQDFILNLQNIRLANSHIYYHSLPGKVIIKAFIKKADISGSVSPDLTTIKANSDAYLNALAVNQNSILSSRHCKLKTVIEVKKDLYVIKTGKLKLSNIDFDVNGTIKEKEGHPYVNINVNGSNMSIRSFLSLMPPRYIEDLRKYSSNGDFHFKATLKGKVSSGYFPNFEADFGIKNGEITKKNTKWLLSNVNLDGYYSSSFNREKNLLKINDFTALLGNSSVEGNISIENFKSPCFELQTNSSLDLNDLTKYFKIDTLVYLQGKANCVMEIKGTVKNPQKIEREEILSWQRNGNFDFSHLDLQIKGSHQPVRDAVGKVRISDAFDVENMSFTIAGNRFEFKGLLYNLPEYFLNQEIISIKDANLYSPILVVDSFKNSSSTKDGAGFLPFPKRISFSGNVHFDKFFSDKFNAQQVTISLTYKPTIFALHSTEMQAMDGSIIGGGAMVLNKEGALDVITHLELTNIDITQLFYTFHNFNQQVLTAENIKGSLSGNISFAANWDKDQKIVKSSIYSECQVSVQNGELIHFEPMLNLSRFCEVSELMDIKFSNLKNEILISDEKVIIPQMDITSNAFNISGSGIHYFNNQYEYKIKILLSDVLFGKAKTAKKENREYAIFEEEDKSKASLYFTIKGSGKEYKINYDKKTALEAIKQDLMEEKQELKTLLKEEFGWFKKDSSLNQNDGVQSKKPIFIIEWEDDAPVQSTPDEEEKKNKKPFRIEWNDE